MPDEDPQSQQPDPSNNEAPLLDTLVAIGQPQESDHGLVTPVRVVHLDGQYKADNPELVAAVQLVFAENGATTVFGMIGAPSEDDLRAAIDRGEPLIERPETVIVYEPE